jgi:hypothetical protein
MAYVLGNLIGWPESIDTPKRLLAELSWLVEQMNWQDDEELKDIFGGGKVNCTRAPSLEERGVPLGARGQGRCDELARENTDVGCSPLRRLPVT